MWRAQRSNRQRGLTAIEITAVATIMAILALILLPLLQERVEKARITAAQSDLKQISKAQMLVFADNGFKYARLQDLDNTPFLDLTDPVASLDDLHKDAPHTFWNEEITDDRRESLSRNWEGPYLAMNRTVFVDILLQDTPWLFWGAQGDGGPVLITQRENQSGVTLAQDRYPMDPWNSPYIFFGKGELYNPDDYANIPNSPMQTVSIPPAPPVGVAEETDFGTAAVYSMGPDGQPGGGQPLDPSYLRREVGILGSNDIDAGGIADDLMMQW